MFQVLTDILGNGDYTVVEDFELPPTEARFREVPRFLYDSRIGLDLHKTMQSGGGLWNHQCVALERIGEGDNVVVSTGTASGKSLIFRSAAFHRALINPGERVLVFYPLKALASDQFAGWQDTANRLSLPEGFIGRIDGTVAMNERDAILRGARVLLMTPDVCHAWMMSNLASPAVKQFLGSLGLVILDEAHTMEGVFGSNFAYLFRRIFAARNVLRSCTDGDQALNVIAATATIANPSEHLRRLTGLEFVGVGVNEDGSPHYRRRCVHLGSPAGDEMKIAKAIQVSLLTHSRSGGFITFVDSRKAVELLAVASNRQLQELLSTEEVLPYRAGLDSEDRKTIENQLKEGALRGVVSTSALELGIDLPHLQVGINIGVPPTRKAYRQRLGRVGRNGPGLFVVVADSKAFISFGTSYREYHDMSVEPSYLYLDNRFMQFAHGRCLADELEAAGAKGKSVLPARVDWPNGFRGVFKAARPGGDRPREFDGIAQLGGDLPQRGYPLRNVGEINFKISLGEHADSIGEANLSQALRECYPGATYFHMAKAYRVQAWQTNAFIPFIKVRALGRAPQTKPRIRTWINADLMGREIVEGHLRKGDEGFIAECQMLITERVEGFTEGDSGTYKPYKELREKNPNLRPRMRQFRTTGVLICIDEGWFKEPDHKNFVVARLGEIFCREYSILPQDIGTAATNISLTTSEGHHARSNCIALFDQTYGSLRLTERVYTDLSHLLERFRVAADAENGDERKYVRSLVDRLKVFAEALPAQAELVPGASLDQGGGGGIIQVFARGSRVGLREKGVLFTDIEILQPTIMPDGKLWYQVKYPPKHPGSLPAKRWVNPEFIEATAEDGEWDYALWDSESQNYVEETAHETAEPPPESIDP